MSTEAAEATQAETAAQVAETAAQVAEKARQVAESAAEVAETAQQAAGNDDGDPPADPTPETALRRSRQGVDDAMASLASADVEEGAGNQRVAELEADLERARAQAATAADAKRARVQILHDACDASIEAIQGIKAAHPLPEAPAAG